MSKGLSYLEVIDEDDSKKLEEELKTNNYLQDEVINISKSIAPWIPYIGLTLAGVSIGKYAYTRDIDKAQRRRKRNKINQRTMALNLRLKEELSQPQSLPGTECPKIEPFRMIIDGRSNCGKTKLLIELLKYFQQNDTFEQIIIICPKFPRNKTYQNEDFIFRDKNILRL